MSLDWTSLAAVGMWCAVNGGRSRRSTAVHAGAVADDEVIGPEAGRLGGPRAVGLGRYAPRMLTGQVKCQWRLRRRRV